MVSERLYNWMRIDFSLLDDIYVCGPRGERQLKEERDYGYLAKHTVAEILDGKRYCEMFKARLRYRAGITGDK